MWLVNVLCVGALCPYDQHYSVGSNYTIEKSKASLCSYNNKGWITKTCLAMYVVGISF